MRKTSDFKIYDKMAEFALISKEVKDQILKKNKSYNFFRAEIGYSGYSSKSIDYKEIYECLVNPIIIFWSI